MKAYRFNAKGVAFWGYLAILLIVILMASCGTRKVRSSKGASKSVYEEKDTSKGNSSKTSISSDESTVKEQAAVVKEDTETSTTTKYDKDTGKPIESTTTTKKSKTIDNSTKESKSLKTKINRVDSTFNNTNYRKVLITEHKKTKDTDSDKSFVTNIGGPWVVGFIALLVVVAIFLYFYLKRRSQWLMEVK